MEEIYIIIDGKVNGEFIDTSDFGLHTISLLANKVVEQIRDRGHSTALVSYNKEVKAGKLEYEGDCTIWPQKSVTIDKLSNELESELLKSDGKFIIAFVSGGDNESLLN